MTDIPTPGLRERKRAATRARLEAAAVAIVLSKGLENTTVEEISAMADVSPRTFFNYFDTKDSAILGPSPTDVADPEVADPSALEDEAGVIPFVTGLLASSLGTISSAEALRADRAEVFRRYPQLRADHLTQITAVVGRLTAVVQARLARDPRFADLDEAALLDYAEVLLATCGAAGRVALRQWTVADADETQLRQRTIELVNQLTRRLP